MLGHRVADLDRGRRAAAVSPPRAGRVGEEHPREQGEPDTSLPPVAHGEIDRRGRQACRVGASPHEDGWHPPWAIGAAARHRSGGTRSWRGHDMPNGIYPNPRTPPRGQQAQPDSEAPGLVAARQRLDEELARGSGRRVGPRAGLSAPASSAPTGRAGSGWPTRSRASCATATVTRLLQRPAHARAARRCASAPATCARSSTGSGTASRSTSRVWPWWPGSWATGPARSTTRALRARCGTPSARRAMRSIRSSWWRLRRAARSRSRELTRLSSAGGLEVGTVDAKSDL